jgi:hypothetical protein
LTAVYAVSRRDSCVIIDERAGKAQKRFALKLKKPIHGGL